MSMYVDVDISPRTESMLLDGKLDGKFVTQSYLCSSHLKYFTSSFLIFVFISFSEEPNATTKIYG